MSVLRVLALSFFESLAWACGFAAIGAGLAWYVGYLWSTFGAVFGQ